MEGTYACNLNNRFELFLDEKTDPSDILAKSLEKRKGTDKVKDNKKDAKKKGLSESLKESVKSIAAAVDPNAPKPLAGRTNVGSTSPTQAGGNAGGRPPRRDNLERRNNGKNFEARPDGDRPPRENRGPRDFNRPPRNPDGPRPEGGRNPRGDGNRGSRDGPRTGGRGREYDRHSGDVRSGVKATEKRGGQGAHNWGKITEFDGPAEPEIPENLDVTPEAAAGDEPAASAEPENVLMTLEQWKKEQASKMSKTEYAASIRKPNEGEKEDPKLKKAIVLKKKKADEDSDDAEGDDAHDAEDEDEKMKKELEQTLASQFHFADTRGPSRSGRGGRSSGPQGPRRDDGPAPAGRQSRGGKPQHTPRVEDLNDFPSLAA